MNGPLCIILCIILIYKYLYRFALSAKKAAMNQGTVYTRGICSHLKMGATKIMCRYK